MNETTSPAELREDAEVLDVAAGILWKYDRAAFAGIMRQAAHDLTERSHHPSRQKLRGGTEYTPLPAPGSWSASEGAYRERHGDEPRDDPEPVHDCDGTCPSCQSARHCDIKISNLPGQLSSGRYAMTFTGMEYQPGARPVIRFRCQGRLADAAFTPDEAAEPGS